MDKVVFDLLKGKTNFGFLKNLRIHHPMVQDGAGSKNVSKNLFLAHFRVTFSGALYDPAPS